MSMLRDRPVWGLLTVEVEEAETAGADIALK